MLSLSKNVKTLFLLNKRFTCLPLKVLLFLRRVSRISTSLTNGSLVLGLSNYSLFAHLPENSAIFKSEAKINISRETHFICSNSPLNDTTLFRQQHQRLLKLQTLRLADFDKSNSAVWRVMTVVIYGSKQSFIVKTLRHFFNI